MVFEDLSKLSRRVDYSAAVVCLSFCMADRFFAVFVTFSLVEFIYTSDLDYLNT